MDNKKLVAAVIVALMLIAGAAYKLYLQQENDKLFTGTIEVTQADVTPKVSGYIQTVMADEGDEVTKGMLLCVIERKDYAVQLQKDEAALKQAQYILQDLEKGARREELQEAAANVAAYTSIYHKAYEDWQRYSSLYQSGAVSQQQYAEAENNKVVAEKQLAAAEASQRLLLRGTRNDQIEAQKQEVKRCEAVVQASKNNVAYTDLYSPGAGVVLTKNYEAGEYVNAGSAVLTVALLDDCWVKIYVPSAMLGKVNYGQKAKVKIDAYPDRIFTGKVRKISDRAEYTPRQSITPDERANMVFAVEVSLDNEAKILKPGMIADVMFDG